MSQIKANYEKFCQEKTQKVRDNIAAKTTNEKKKSYPNKGGSFSFINPCQETKKKQGAKGNSEFTGKRQSRGQISTSTGRPNVTQGRQVPQNDRPNQTKNVSLPAAPPNDANNISVVPSEVSKDPQQSALKLKLHMDGEGMWANKAANSSNVGRNVARKSTSSISQSKNVFTDVSNDDCSILPPRCSKEVKSPVKRHSEASTPPPTRGIDEILKSLPSSSKKQKEVAPSICVEQSVRKRELIRTPPEDMSQKTQSLVSSPSKHLVTQATNDREMNLRVTPVPPLNPQEALTNQMKKVGYGNYMYDDSLLLHHQLPSASHVSTPPQIKELHHQLPGESHVSTPPIIKEERPLVKSTGIPVLILLEPPPAEAPKQTTKRSPTKPCHSTKSTSESPIIELDKAQKTSAKKSFKAIPSTTPDVDKDPGAKSKAWSPIKMPTTSSSPKPCASTPSESLQTATRKDSGSTNSSQHEEDGVPSQIEGNSERKRNTARKSTSMASLKRVMETSAKTSPKDSTVSPAKVTKQNPESVEKPSSDLQVTRGPSPRQPGHLSQGSPTVASDATTMEVGDLSSWCDEDGRWPGNNKVVTSSPGIAIGTFCTMVTDQVCSVKLEKLAERQSSMMSGMSTPAMDGRNAEVTLEQGIEDESRPSSVGSAASMSSIRTIKREAFEESRASGGPSGQPPGIERDGSSSFLSPASFTPIGISDIQENRDTEDQITSDNEENCDDADTRPNSPVSDSTHPSSIIDRDDIIINDDEEEEEEEEDDDDDEEEEEEDDDDMLSEDDIIIVEERPMEKPWFQQMFEESLTKDKVVARRRYSGDSHSSSTDALTMAIDQVQQSIKKEDNPEEERTLSLPLEIDRDVVCGTFEKEDQPTGHNDVEVNNEPSSVPVIQAVCSLAKRPEESKVPGGARMDDEGVDDTTTIPAEANESCNEDREKAVPPEDDVGKQTTDEVSTGAAVEEEENDQMDVSDEQQDIIDTPMRPADSHEELSSTVAQQEDTKGTVESSTPRLDHPPVRGLEKCKTYKELLTRFLHHIYSHCLLPGSDSDQEILKSSVKAVEIKAQELSQHEVTSTPSQTDHVITPTAPSKEQSPVPMDLHVTQETAEQPTGTSSTRDEQQNRESPSLKRAHEETRLLKAILSDKDGRDGKEPCPAESNAQSPSKRLRAESPEAPSKVHQPVAKSPNGKLPPSFLKQTLASSKVPDSESPNPRPKAADFFYRNAKGPCASATVAKKTPPESSVPPPSAIQVSQTPPPPSLVPFDQVEPPPPVPVVLSQGSSPSGSPSLPRASATAQSARSFQPWPDCDPGRATPATVRFCGILDEFVEPANVLVTNNNFYVPPHTLTSNRPSLNVQPEYLQLDFWDDNWPGF